MYSTALGPDNYDYLFDLSMLSGWKMLPQNKYTEWNSNDFFSSYFENTQDWIELHVWVHLTNQNMNMHRFFHILFDQQSKFLMFISSIGML